MAVATESTHDVTVPALVVTGVTTDEAATDRVGRDGVTRGVRSCDLEANSHVASATETVTEGDAGTAVNSVMTREEEAGKARDKTRGDQLHCVTADTGSSRSEERTC